jgi:hypothetical protein
VGKLVECGHFEDWEDGSDVRDFLMFYQSIVMVNKCTLIIVHTAFYNFLCSCPHELTCVEI